MLMQLVERLVSCSVVTALSGFLLKSFGERC